MALALLGGLAYLFKKGNNSRVPDYSVEKDGNMVPLEMGGGSRPAELMTAEQHHRVELSA